MGKVTRPIVADVLFRKRLFDLIDRIKNKPVIWVMGPPGCGKTTLISSYIESREISCIWYKLDEGDNDLENFFYFMDLAARKVVPRSRKSPTLLTPEYLQDIPSVTRRYFRDFCKGLKVPGVLVFDNYHEVPESAALHGVILKGLSDIPKGITIMIISRKEPPAPYSVLCTNHLMELLGWDDLRLTHEESRGIIRLLAPQIKSKETIRRIHDSALGWVAGLVLMLERVKREGIGPQVTERLIEEGIFDYFGSELFDKMDKEIQDFLLVMHELGREQEAVGHLGHCFRSALQTKSKVARFYALMAEAEFAFDREDEASGLKSLREALNIGREGGYLNTFVDRPAVTARLCVRALEAGIEVEYVQDLIRRHNLIPDTPPVHLENWPWEVKIFTLGRFSLVRNGKPVRFSGKTPLLPLALLKAIIAMGGRNVNVITLALLLWPDATGDAAHQDIKTTLHRLRKLIGNDIVQHHGGSLSLDARYCWVDIWAFERILSRIEREVLKDINYQNFFNTILSLYHGPFLTNDDSPWVLTARERLRSKFFRSLRRLGQKFCEEVRCEQAILVYQKGLEVDNLVEEFYRNLMFCHSALGNRASALETYHLCRRTLGTIFGIEPSQETQTLYQAISKGPSGAIHSHCRRFKK